MTITLDDEFRAKFDALIAIVSAAGQLTAADQAHIILKRVLAMSITLDDSESKSNLLRGIALAYSQLAETNQAQAHIRQALTIATMIRKPVEKISALTDIATTVDKLTPSNHQARDLLDQALVIAAMLDGHSTYELSAKSFALRRISAAAVQLRNIEQAQEIFRTSLSNG